MATVRMPNSLQAQMTRRAISPRFAIRIFLNMLVSEAKNLLPQRQRDTEKSEKGETFTRNNNVQSTTELSLSGGFSILLVFPVSLCLRGKSGGSHVDYFF